MHSRFVIVVFFTVFFNTISFAKSIPVLPPQPPPPSISINDIADEFRNQIDKKQAPFKIHIKGNASRAVDLYTYLVVDDGNAQWIESTNDFGFNIDGNFSGYCYL